ncbi:MAG: flippase [Candidatus Hodarchaeota archaeon]
MKLKVNKVTRDLLLFTSSQFLHKIVGYFVFMILFRYLDKTKTGEFFFAATLASFFALLTEFGTNNYLNREVAQNCDKALRHLSEVISLRLPFMGFSFLVLNTLVFLFKPDLLTIVLLTSVYVFVGDLYYSFGALFIGLRRVTDRIITGLAGQLLLAGLVGITVTLKGSLYAILSCYIFANMVMVGITVHFVRRKIGKFGLLWDSNAARKVLRLSFPFFVLTVLGLIHFKVDTLMLGWMRSYAAVATYEAGFKLLEVSRFIVRPAAIIFFPMCSAMVASQAWLELKDLFRKLLLVTGTLGTVISLVVILMAAFIMSAVFGPKYGESVPILRVLYLTVPSLYVGFVSTFMAYALHLEKSVMKIMPICVIVNIFLNSISIPLWGTYGAAWTTVISETLFTVWLLRMIFQKLHALPIRDFAKTSRISPLRPSVIVSKLNGSEGIVDHDATL